MILALQTSYWNEGVAEKMTKAADLEMQCLLACKIVPWELHESSYRVGFMAGVAWLCEELIAVAERADNNFAPVNLTHSYYSDSLAKT